MRLARIEDLDLSLFDFDYDLTLMVFFINADEKVYGRYGGRDPQSADSRQSMAGLRYTMQAALQAHRNQQISPALQKRRPPEYFQRQEDLTAPGSCIHCHQIKERDNLFNIKNTDERRRLAWRYPLPDNLGVVLEVDRGDVVDQVLPHSPAAKIGLRPGDVVERLGGFPVHSFADAQFVLDRAPPQGALEIRWRRSGRLLQGSLELPARWRKTDISWRASMRPLAPKSAHVFGKNLTANEKRELELSPTALAFHQAADLSSAAKDAEIKPGDIILGFDNLRLEMTASSFRGYVRRNYLVGDRVTVNLVRDGQRLNLSMTIK